MYSDADLDEAVRRGDIAAEAAAALRRSAAQGRAPAEADTRGPDADALEGERLRLVSGFHDVSVAGAALLTLVCLAVVAARMGVGAVSFVSAVAAWGLAEHFTRVRRLALTSIVLLLVLAAAVGGAVAGVVGAQVAGAARFFWPGRGGFDPVAAMTGPGVLLLAAISAAAALHWMRFRVPAAMGLLAAAAAGLVLAILLVALPGGHAVAEPLTFAAGLAVFAFAMRWDLSDPVRRTLRADVAFWLHLASAPMIVGPAFAAIGVYERVGSAGATAAAVGLYLALSAVALVIDRRALMASALFYLLFAVGSLLFSKATFVSALPAAGLVVGIGLLLLSAFWGSARRAVLAALPEGLVRRLPPAPAAPPSGPAKAA